MFALTGICWCYALVLMRATFLSDNAAFHHSVFSYAVVECLGVKPQLPGQWAIREMSKRLGRKKYRVYKEVTGSMVTELPTLLQ